jgi:hypothetical protein
LVVAQVEDLRTHPTFHIGEASQQGGQRRGEERQAEQRQAEESKQRRASRGKASKGEASTSDLPFSGGNHRCALV